MKTKVIHILPLIFITFCSLQVNAINLFGDPQAPVENDLNPLDPNYDYPLYSQTNLSDYGLPFKGDFYTGYITVNPDTGSKFYYVLYSAGGRINPASRINDTAPMIVLITGGPGMSGTSFENWIGPYGVVYLNNGTAYPTENMLTWNDKYHLLFLDFPAGVGYSVYGGDDDKIDSSAKVGEQTEVFMRGFYDVFPTMRQNKLYFAGLSYGGHSAPNMAAKIIENYDQNQIKVDGVFVMEGWVDARYQSQFFSEYGYSVGLIDEKGKKEAKLLEDVILGALDIFDYEAAYLGLIGIAVDIDKKYNYTLNILNYRNNSINLQGGPAGPSANDTWYNSWNVKKDIYHANPSTNFSSFSAWINKRFKHDLMKGQLHVIDYILNNDKYPCQVLLTMGQDDLLTNLPGQRNLFKHMKWSGMANYFASKKVILKDPQGYVIGNAQHYDRLTGVVINKAGHMGSYDQPFAFYDALQRLVDENWA